MRRGPTTEARRDQYDPYGTSQWFEQEYAKVQDDPWGLTWRPSQLLRYNKVLSMLDALEGPHAHVMDVGCATGDFTYLLSQHVRGNQTVSGVDFADTALERARRKFPGLAFSKESIFDLGDRYQDHFDLVTCLEVLYYVEKDRQIEAIRSVRRALRPGGHAVFSSLVSPPPYFVPRQLLDLVGREFEIIEHDILHLRMVSFLEKAGSRFAKLMPFSIGTQRPGRLPYPTVVAIERCSRALRSLAASHTIVLACARPSTRRAPAH